MHKKWPAYSLGVANSGATAPFEDIMAGRADAAPINRKPYVPMSRQVKDLAVLLDPKIMEAGN
jgi:hypothetical protein